MDYSTHEVPGRLGEMTCTCGGQLREFRTVIVPEYEPPHHRKKRIRKKWRKRWERESPILRGVCAMAGLMQRPWYRCEKCGKRDGFYSAVGRNFIKIEPLPDGALPFYDREPEKAEEPQPSPSDEEMRELKERLVAHHHDNLKAQEAAPVSEEPEE